MQPVHLLTMPSPVFHVESTERSLVYSLLETEVFLLAILFREKVNDSSFKLTFGKEVNQFKYSYYYKEYKAYTSAY